MTDDEARKECEWIWRLLNQYKRDEELGNLNDKAVDLLFIAYKQWRKEALEEAAKLIEEGSYMSGDPIAEDIRELKED